ncbi:MAG: hypothetical protein JXA42_05010 [Anaerolineales bacterium]|nr:hypothetical protein [Anaerolineales bacterium]
MERYGTGLNLLMEEEAVVAFDDEMAVFLPMEIRIRVGIDMQGRDSRL